jgi:hypothetical protein
LRPSYQRGDYPGTLRLALGSLDEFPEHRAEVTFWAARMRSAMRDPAAAVRLLHDGLQEGMWWAPTLLRDADLEAAREIDGFADLSFKSERRWAAACSQIQPIVRLHAPAEFSGPLLIVLHGWTADDRDVEPLWVGVVDIGVAVAYTRSFQPDTSDRSRFYWVGAQHTSRALEWAFRSAPRVDDAAPTGGDPPGAHVR